LKRKVNATRMELLRIRKRLTLASRGHKLLKDKLQGLIKLLNEKLDEYKILRKKVNQEFPQILSQLLIAQSLTTPSTILEALNQTKAEIHFSILPKKMMGVKVPAFEFNLKEKGMIFSMINTPVQFDQALNTLKSFFKDIMALGCLEETIRILAREIEKTKRRSNALEYSVIPELEEVKRNISSRLEEIARSDISRLMKIKQMLLEKGK